MRQIKGVLILLLILAINSVNGQSISSVYSGRGIGLLNYQGLPNNLAMGEVGIAVPSTWNLNYQNPAFLPFNNLMMFQVGIEMEQRNLSNSQESAKEVSGGLRYLNFAFPVVARKWTTSFGITPFSTVNQKSYSLDTISETQTPILIESTEAGGLTSFGWSNGFKLSDKLYVGLRTSYLFGSIEGRNRIRLLDDSNVNVNDFIDKSTYSGLGMELSGAYRKELSKESVLNFGVVYELSRDITGSRNRTLEVFTSLGSQPSVPTAEEEHILFSIPSSIGLGTSYQVFNKFLIGVDVKSTNWKSAGTDTETFINTTKTGIGGQWTPDFGSVTKYWNRVTYRMGVTFENLPYKVNGQTIREVGINFGGSLPVGLSSLDLAFKYGGLGSIDNDLIRETYFRIVIGATINDRWFIKRRYD